MKKVKVLPHSKKTEDWYKEEADKLDSYTGITTRGADHYMNKKVGYDLYNGILDTTQLEYLTNVHSRDLGEVPIDFKNRDIVSPRIKYVLGLEMERSSKWKLLAVNPEATTRKEEEEVKRIKNWVIDYLTKDIRIETEKKYKEELNGKELSEEEVNEIKQKIEKEIVERSPEATKKYMARKHQDPAEVLHAQLLEYFYYEQDLEIKFKEVLEHTLLSAEGIMYVGILNGKPVAEVVNPLRFKQDFSGDIKYTQDKEWATYEYRWGPAQILSYFGDSLTKDEIETIFSSFSGGTFTNIEDYFSISEQDGENLIPVVHCVWKGVRKLGILHYRDEDGETQKTIVGEEYKLDEEFGDIRIVWKYYPESYETWIIKTGEKIYKNMQPIPGQFKDIDDMYNCKLPYYGVVTDNNNSTPTSMMSRMFEGQVLYSILIWRIENLMATDRGKKILMNYKAIPSSMGFEKWEYYADTSPYLWYDDTEEGQKDAGSIAKALDLSLATDIQKYIDIAEYVRKNTGRIVGITDQAEGQIGQHETATNTKRAITQSSLVLELYLETHNQLKKHVLLALVNAAKIAYADSDSKVLTYTLDDMSVKTLTLDMGLLNTTTLGLFMSDPRKAAKIEADMKELTQAALHSQKIEFSDVLNILRQDGLIEIEETLRVAEEDRRQIEVEAQNREIQAQKENTDKLIKRGKEEHKEELEKILLKEEERRKTVIIQSSLTGASFNSDMDKDRDGVNDFIELARDGLKAKITQSKQQLARQEFEHKKEMDKERLKLEEKKLIQNKKK